MFRKPHGCVISSKNPSFLVHCNCKIPLAESCCKKYLTDVAWCFWRQAEIERECQIFPNIPKRTWNCIVVIDFSTIRVATATHIIQEWCTQCSKDDDRRCAHNQGRNLSTQPAGMGDLHMSRTGGGNSNIRRNVHPQKLGKMNPFFIYIFQMGWFNRQPWSTWNWFLSQVISHSLLVTPVTPGSGPLPFNLEACLTSYYFYNHLLYRHANIWHSEYLLYIYLYIYLFVVYDKYLQMFF